MGDRMISVEGLSKRYVIGHQKARGDGLRHSLETVLRSPIRWLTQKIKTRADETEEFWALKDVSFEIKRGEVVGIIGRNGAGKSTLLKILSRITEPTAGRIRIRGRVASLLEVGTGFHPELTGRENIFLNGAILGMRKSEIVSKFDEIVTFSEIEKFLDTPVKRYSSGMYVRLAFAVAAHLDPEILVVDEVLAVGDAAFQRKCLGKMQDVSSKEGRTVIFVSHSMATISRLCSLGLLLQDGQRVHFGRASDAIEKYNEKAFSTASERVWNDDATAPGNEMVKIRAVRVLPREGISSKDTIDVADGCSIQIEYEVLKIDGDRVPIAAIHVVNENGIVLFSSADFDRGLAKSGRAHGRMRVACHIPGDLLAEGRFTVLAAVVNYNPNIVHALVPEAVSFQAVDLSGNSIRGQCAQDWPGVCRPRLKWS
jgi:lipopolysaccharide transport system ATP-binding protein